MGNGSSRKHSGARARLAALTVAAAIATSPAAALAALGDCGQPATSGDGPAASDALFVLRAAVAIASCEPCVCDVDYGGGDAAITATDALRVLRKAVGQAVALVCPPCGPPPCEDAAVAICNGTCPEGTACGRDAADPDFCRCLNECEQQGAATCGGSCGPGDELGLECAAVRFGGDPGIVDTCTCIPADFRVCVDGDAPACNGPCEPGSLCQPDGAGSCACERQPRQGPCAEAEAPSCGGVCTAGTVCTAGAEGCACTPEEPEAATCLGSGQPTCGGSCAGGRLCANDFLRDCECFDPCELADAPACAGACADPEATCVYRTVGVGGTAIEYCDCLVNP